MLDWGSAIPRPAEFGSFVMGQGLTARIVGLPALIRCSRAFAQEAEEAARREPELALFLADEHSQP